MARVRDAGERFRPAGAPGAAGRVGVPADRAAELRAELEPMLTLLDPVHAQCAQIVEAAEQEAARIGAAGQAEATRIAGQSARQAVQARNQAARQVFDEAAAQAREATAAAGGQARAVHRLAGQQTPALVSRALSLVQAVSDGLAAALARDPVPPGGGLP